MATFSNRPWDSSEASADQSASDYCATCLLDSNPSGKEKIKALCNLPLQYTPDGPYVLAAIRNASGRIFQVKGHSAEKKKEAARRLISLSREGGIAVGSANLFRLAGMKQPK